MEFQSHKPISFDFNRGNFKNKEIIGNFKQEAESYFKIFNELLEVVIIHEDDMILFINKEGLNLLGLESADKLIGKRFINIQCLNNPFLFLKSMKADLVENSNYPELIHKILGSLKIKTTDINILSKTVSMTLINLEIPNTTLNPNTKEDKTYIRKYLKHLISIDPYSEFIAVSPKRSNIENNENLLNFSNTKYSYFEELMNKMINCIIIYSAVNNGSKFIIKYMNQAAEQLTSLNSKDVIGKDIIDVFPSLRESEFCNLLNRVNKTGVAEKTPISYYSDKRIKLWKQNYLFKLSSGEIVSVIDNMCDIVKLINQLKKYKILFEQTKDIILFLDSKGSIIEANRAALKAYGYKREEILLKSISDLRNESSLDLIENQMKEAKNKGIYFETSHKSKCGYKFPAEVSSIGTTIDGKEVYCSIIRDISERKKSQLNLQKSRKKLNDLYEYEKLRTEYIANLSHEFMTPLNLILCSQQIVKMYLNSEFEDNTKKNILNVCSTISLNCYRLIKLTNNFLDMTKIDSGMMKLNLYSHNIVDIVEQTCEAAVPFANRKNIFLTFDTDVEEKNILCDKEKIQRIILNLLSNSIKFTSPSGKIQVNLFSKDKDNILISVKDTGAGLAKEKQKFIFNRFSQIDKSFTRAQEGSGLGLFLVKSLIDIHKGKIQVKSSLGAGSTFIIQLPTNNIESLDKNTYPLIEYNREPYLDKAHIEFSDIYFD
jgi:PAS domain S-box-containing protein